MDQLLDLLVFGEVVFISSFGDVVSVGGGGPVGHLLEGILSLSFSNAESLRGHNVVLFLFEFSKLGQLVACCS